MKMNELPNNAKGQPVQIDAKGKNVLMEYFPDGDVFFWTDDGICLEFDRKNTALIIAALRQQEKLPKTSRAASPTLAAVHRPPGALVATSLRTGSGSEVAKHKEPNRSVAKEAQGWGATVVVNGKPARYYYEKRDNARVASADHQVGEAGRVA